MSNTLSLSLSLFQLTWASDEVPPANPRRAFVLFQVTGGETNQKLPCHQGKNSINSLAPSVGTIQSFLQKEKSGSGDRQNKSFVNCGFSQI
jgi:hypothetical protein